MSVPDENISETRLAHYIRYLRFIV